MNARNKFKLSIITVNYNNCNGLRKNIESEITQTFTKYEFLIIDGDSTDGSKTLIKKYTDKLHYWVSEKDCGVYNAMNKGVQKANGEYILMLNSGDYLCDDDVLLNVFKNNFSEKLIYGN